MAPLFLQRKQAPKEEKERKLNKSERKESKKRQEVKAKTILEF